MTNGSIELSTMPAFESELFARLSGRNSASAGLLAVALAAIALLSSCVGNRAYNASPEEYLQAVDSLVEGRTAELATIEFDEYGVFWKREQLEDTLELIRRRNAEAEHGVLVLIHTHGWNNNANPAEKKGDLQRFRDALTQLTSELEADGEQAPDRVIGVYLGWRGASTGIPLFRELTFWGRKHVASRVASYNVRETYFRLTEAAKVRPDSKVVISGHSMGGLIVAKTLGPSISTLLLTVGGQGLPAFADLVLMQNPALDALSSMHLIDFLKRSKARVELHYPDGSIREAPGPIIVSLTSEADWVTRMAYPAGQIVGNIGARTRSDHEEGEPSQWSLITHAHGHVDYLISHEAKLVDGEVVIERVPGAYNDTPFWIVRVSGEICSSHGDIYNQNYLDMVGLIVRLNKVYEPGVKTWIRTVGFDTESAKIRVSALEKQGVE